MELSVDMLQAETYLQTHNESILHMQNCVFEVLQRGQELAQVGSKAVDAESLSRP